MKKAGKKKTRMPLPNQEIATWPRNMSPRLRQVGEARVWEKVVDMEIYISSIRGCGVELKLKSSLHFCVTLVMELQS